MLCGTFFIKATSTWQAAGITSSTGESTIIQTHIINPFSAGTDSGIRQNLTDSDSDIYRHQILTNGAFKTNNLSTYTFSGKLVVLKLT